MLKKAPRPIGIVYPAKFKEIPSDMLLDLEEHIGRHYIDAADAHYQKEAETIRQDTIREIKEWGDDFCSSPARHKPDDCGTLLASTRKKKDCPGCWQSLEEGK